MEGNNFQFKLLSLNVRGIRSFEKRECVFNWLLKQNADIFFLQETYSTKEIENQWRKQWRGELFFSHGTSRSKGVLVLVRENLDFKVKSTYTDDSGRFIFLDTLIQDSPFLLVNIYAPTKASEQCQFLDEIAFHIADKVCQSEHYIITGGDFNATFEPNLDCSGGRPSIKNCIKNLNDIMLQNDLVDIWRVRNPDKKRFTWRQKNPLIQRRLDFWLISNSLQDDIENVDILTSVKSDHSAIILNIDSVKNLNHGPSFWKFNNSLLDDEQYIKLIEQLVPDWIEEINYSDDARVQWDWLKYNIRKETITYSKAKAKERREKIKRIETQLKIAEEKLADSPNDDTQNEFDALKSAYEKEYDYITKGAIIRSRATWYEKGEKNNKYFLNLQNNKKTKSTIRKLERKNGNITVDPKCIMDELHSFYSDLYKEKNSEELTYENCPFLNSGNIPKLSPAMRELCEGELTIAECFNTLSSFQNNKTPGNDGLTVEFYKCFWKLMGSLLVNCLNCAYKHGELSSSQKQALIVLIEKKDKDRRQVKNWRPISLINVDVKIGTKAIAKRLEKVLPEIIHHSQNAYVKGRTIFDAVRTIDDIIKLTSSNNMGSLLVAIDFEKAFGSVNWNFLRHALRKFNFGPSFITWITAFYSNISSCVMNNGFITQPFKLSRGVRQGDPLSPYLFILVLETLAIHIRNDECIKGINVDGHEIKLIIFADDLTVFLKDSASFHCLLAKLELFGQYSGLNVNRGKTEVMKLGTPEISAEELKIDEIKKVVKILGIHFTYDQTLSDKLNFHTIIKSIRKSINSWNWRGLTLLGKIQIIKSFAIPKILYRLSLVSTNKTFVKEVNQVLYNFVWKGKDKVKRLALINSVENGGLNMPHIESLIDTQRIVCIKKYLGDSPCSWKIILDHYLHKVGGSLLFHCNFEYTKLPLDLPDYYRECLATWTKLTASPVSSMDEIVNQILWNNKFICIGQKSVFNRKLFSLGLHKVGDLFNEIYIKPHTTLQNLNAVDFLFLNGLYDCLPPEWKKVMTNDPPSVLIKINHIWDDVFLYSSNDALLLSELSSKKIYNILVSKISISPSAKKKFEDSYASTEQALDWKRIYSNAFKCAIDTKTREFQYKILNRILPLNDFLFKIGKSNSPLCSFCQSSEENMSHFFFHCPLVANFWQSVKHLLGGYGLIEREVILGITDTVENVFLKNHLILLGKQHIFRCKHNNSLPSAISFTKTLKAVFDSERLIAKENNKINLHYDKWKDLLGYLLSF